MFLTELKAGEGEKIKALQGPSIMVVTRGKGSMKADGNEVDVTEGYVYFIGFDAQIELVAEGEGEGLETDIAYCEA